MDQQIPSASHLDIQELKHPDTGTSLQLWPGSGSCWLELIESLVMKHRSSPTPHCVSWVSNAWGEGNVPAVLISSGGTFEH